MAFKSASQGFCLYEALSREVTLFFEVTQNPKIDALMDKGDNIPWPEKREERPALNIPPGAMASIGCHFFSGDVSKFCPCAF
jgi:hypothetical protein